MDHEEQVIFEGLPGGGIYNSYSKPQQKAILPTLPLIERAIQELEETIITPNLTVFSVADFGSAEGGNSMLPMKHTINCIRKKHENLQITITHTDLPKNDWCSLFQTVKNDTSSYLKDSPKVFTFASGTSFYQQIFPDDSLCLAFSSTAFHWMSKKPCNVTNHIFGCLSESNEFPFWRKKAQEDWRNIIACRSAELKSGGKMVLGCVGKDEKMNTFSSCDIVNTMNDVLVGMVNEKIISEKEYHSFSHPIYSTRTRADFQENLDEFNLSMDDFFLETIPNPYYEEFLTGHDSKKFANNLVNFTKVWINGTLENSISERASESMDKVKSIFYDRCRAKVEMNPYSYKNELVECYMLLTKH